MRPPASSAVAVAVEAPTASTLLSDYKELLKPGITAFVVVMAAAGYLLGATGPVDWRVLLGLMVGTGLTGGGAAALNHVIERKHDARMARTASRPLPGGRMGPVHATLYATACVVAEAVVPAAATGSLDPVGWALFAILYLWQLPHFYALAWMFRDDYQRGGFRMLPTADEGERTLASLVLVASLMLLVAGVIPAAIGQAGMLFLIGMAGLGTAFTIPAFSFFSEPTDERARRLLYASILYVPAFFVLVVADFLLR